MLLKLVRQTIRRHKLLKPLERILVGVSGGADSVALLAALRQLSAAGGQRLTVAHLNHGIRGKAAASDAAFVAELARRWKLPVVVGRANVPKLARSSALSLEMAARKARYAFFAKVAKAHRCPALATAHTADDQAETILLNLARGAGASGLAGIPYSAWHALKLSEPGHAGDFAEAMAHTSGHGRLRVIRPLRDVDRNSVERFLRQRHLAWREDATNADLAFLRNRVRHEILPFLEKRLNPKIRQALLRCGEILSGENEWLATLTERSLAECRPRPNSLAVERLIQLPLAARRRVLRRWLEVGKAADAARDFATIERLDALALTHRRGSAALTLPGGWQVDRKGTMLVLARRAAESHRPFSRRLAVPGVTRLARAGVRITARLNPGIVKERSPEIGALPARASLSLSVWRRRQLTARSWRNGDRMRPLGLKGSKKLQDIFSDGKVPRELRKRLPIITCGDEIIWIPGFRIAQGWAVSPRERQALQLMVEPYRPE